MVKYKNHEKTEIFAAIKIFSKIDFVYCCISKKKKTPEDKYP